jgi:hypothetical protein
MTLKRFMTILLSSFFLIVFINFAVITQDTQSQHFLSFYISDILRYMVCSLMFISVVLVLFINSEFLRSPGKKGFFYSPDENKLIPAQCQKIGKEQDNPYSLSQFQLAFWTVLIFGSYLLIFAVTKKYENTINSSATILLGINGGTAVFNSIIDGGKSDFEQKGSARTSEGFWYDILSDGNGYNFHRLQAFIWTIALGFVFINEVINNGKMPDFDSSLLALQGISSGTFVGLRSTEKQENKEKPSENKTKLTFSIDEKDKTLKLDKVEINGITLDNNNSFTDKSDLKITEKPVISTVEIEVKKSQ